MVKLNANNFICQQAEEDADALIVNTALAVAKINIENDCDEAVIIVGQDIDLLVILHQLNTKNLDVHFYKPGAGKVKDTFYSSESFKHDKSLVGFIHCFSGCDTTSAFAGKGKKTTVQSLLKIENLSTFVDVFYNAEADAKIIAENGRKIIAALYKSKNLNQQLNELRFKLYESSVIQSSFKLEKLPPTDGAADQHCFRSYLQLQTWLGNKKNVTDWGWKTDANQSVTPIYTNNTLIPEELLKKK